MDERAAEVGAVDGTGHGLHGRHGVPAFVVLGREVGEQVGDELGPREHRRVAGVPLDDVVGVGRHLPLRLGRDGLVVGADDVGRRDLLPRRRRRSVVVLDHPEAHAAQVTHRGGGELVVAVVVEDRRRNGRVDAHRAVVTVDERGHQLVGRRHRGRRGRRPRRPAPRRGTRGARRRHARSRRGRSPSRRRSDRISTTGPSIASSSLPTASASSCEPGEGEVERLVGHAALVEARCAPAPRHQPSWNAPCTSTTVVMALDAIGVRPPAPVPRAPHPRPTCRRRTTDWSWPTGTPRART